MEKIKKMQHFQGEFGVILYKKKKMDTELQIGEGSTVLNVYHD